VSEVGERGEKEGGRGKKECREGGVVSRARLVSLPRETKGGGREMPTFQ